MDYEKVSELEEIDFYKRFAPYCVGSPKEEVSFDNQYTRANFVFFSDSHIDFFEKEASIDNVKRVIAFANDAPIKYDAIIHTGDVITPFGKHEKAEAMSRAKPFFDIAKESRVPFVFSKGNHDLNDWNNLPEAVFTDDDWSEIFLDFAEENFGIVRQTKSSGAKSTWHYLDIEDRKIRIICVDVQDTDKNSTRDDGTVKYHGGASWYITNEQMNWIANTALNFDNKEEKDWGVIFAMHQHMWSTKDHESAIEKLLEMCVAFNESGTYDESYVNPNPFFNLDVHADFTRYAEEEKRPHVICWLLGHDHVDKYQQRHGINMIWVLNNSASTVSSDARVARLKGTSTQNAFDVVNVDTLHRKIRVFRYGAGVNCYGVGGDRFLPDGIDY